MTTQLAGFSDVTHDSQRTFRTLLESLSRPGQRLGIAPDLTPPSGLSLACAAACLTLFDFETSVWLQPGLPAEVADWLQFHTGCRWVNCAAAATFAVVYDMVEISLSDYAWGSNQWPEASTTVLGMVRSLDEASRFAQMVWSGPGIAEPTVRSLPLSRNFWQQWSVNHAAYPRGVDVFLFDSQSVVGLPRTLQVKEVSV